MYHQEVSQQIETYNADLAYKTFQVSAFSEAAVYVEQDMPLKVEANNFINIWQTSIVLWN